MELTDEEPPKWLKQENRSTGEKEGIFSTFITELSVEEIMQMSHEELLDIFNHMETLSPLDFNSYWAGTCKILRWRHNEFHMLNITKNARHFLLGSRLTLHDTIAQNKVGKS